MLSLMPNSSSMAKISRMWLIESQPATSSAVISGLSTIPSSPKVARKMLVRRCSRSDIGTPSIVSARP